MKITSIKKVASGKYNVLIDNKNYLIYPDVLLELNILKPKEIDNDIFYKIINFNNYYEMYSRIIKYLSFKMRTEKEVEKKLKSLNCDNDNINKIIDNLKKDGYLDNEKYVNAFVSDQLNITLNGPKKIWFELKKLGFNDLIIEKKLLDINDDVWICRINKIIDKKVKLNHSLSEKMFKRKISKDLISLGYDSFFYDNIVNNIAIDESSIKNKEYERLYKLYFKKYDKDQLDNVIKQKLYQKGFK